MVLHLLNGIAFQNLEQLKSIILHRDILGFQIIIEIYIVHNDLKIQRPRRIVYKSIAASWNFKSHKIKLKLGTLQLLTA